MKKYIFVLNAVELLKQLVSGKRVEGVLYIDQDTGKLTFKAYNRVSRRSTKDRLVKKLPWGWVKESMMRIKVFGSFPREMDADEVIGVMEQHSKEAIEAFLEEELIRSLSRPSKGGEFLTDGPKD